LKLISASSTVRQIAMLWAKLEGRRTKEFFKELLSLVHDQGYVSQEQKAFTSGNRNIAYATYVLTAKGQAVMDERAAAVLPVPQVLRELEAKQLAATEQRVEELKKGGMDVSLIPTAELQSGEGPVLEAVQRWTRALQSYRARGSPMEQVLEDRLQKVLCWRQSRAEALAMAPTAVLPEHLAMEIARKEPVTVAALHEIGVRIAGAEQLAKVVEEWQKEEERLKAENMWNKKLQKYRESGNGYAEALEALLSSIKDWRASAAKQLGVTPESVLDDSLAISICYTQPTDTVDLHAIGVIQGNVDALAMLVKRWVAERKASGVTMDPMDDVDDEASMFKAPESAKMVVLEYVTPRKWQHAVYKPRGKGKPPAWEVSYCRFAKGERIKAIAMTQESNKPIQPSTVVAHLLTALMHGKGLNLKRVVEEGEAKLPNQAEWEQVEHACALAKVDVVKVENYAKAEVLAHTPASEAVNRPYQERTPEEQALSSRWYEVLKWFDALMRCGLVPAWEEQPAKRARIK